MSPFPKIHDVYVARVLFATVLLAWAVLLGMDSIVGGGGVMAESTNVGRGTFTFATALIEVAYTIPRRAYTLFPTAAVIGSLLGLGQLAASSELTALRALGISRRRLGGTVVVALAILTVLMMVNGDTLAPWGQRRADDIKDSAKSGDMIVSEYSGLWARDGDTFLNAKNGEERNNGKEHWIELSDVRLFEFDTEGQLKSSAHAATAEHRPGGWLLHNVQRTYFSARAVTQTTAIEEHWKSKLDDNALAASVTQAGSMRTSELSSGIEYRKRNGLDSSELQEVYWGRWFYPLNVLALCIAAIPFAFGNLRSGGLGKRLFIGIVFALGFWLLQMQFVKLASVYKFDFRFAYMFPPVIMMMFSAILFRRRSG